LGLATISTVKQRTTGKVGKIGALSNAEAELTELLDQRQQAQKNGLRQSKEKLKILRR
jgi:hypothetical protein